MKKLIADLKANTNGIRKQFLIGAATLIGAVVAGVVITKLNDDNTPVLILTEVPAPAEETPASEF